MMLSEFNPFETVKFTGEGKVPTRGSNGAAAWDLYANEDVELTGFTPTLVGTGLNVEIPKGYALLILPRSGNTLNKKLIVANSPGLIDEDYRGEIKVILTLNALPTIEQSIGGTVYVHDAKLKISKGDRIAQALLIKYEGQNWQNGDVLTETERSAGGFGSTGN